MKNQTLSSTLNKLILFSCIISASLFAGCSDDPQATNEEEVITTIIVTLIPGTDEANGEGDSVTLSWDDTNLDGIVDASEMITSGPLLVDTTYSASIQILNKSVNPEINISDEIAEEAEEHIFCFSVKNANISITNLNEDKHGLPVGLTSTWTTSSLSTGTVTITLRHQPGVKTGDCPGAGETDATITFEVQLAAGIEEE